MRHQSQQTWHRLSSLVHIYNDIAKCLHVSQYTPLCRRYACSALGKRLYTLERGCESAAVRLQGITHEAIMIELPLTSHRQETSIGQHFEMLRTGRLRHRKTCSELTAAALPRGGNRLQNPEARWVCKGFSNSHHLLLVHGLSPIYISV